MRLRITQEMSHRNRAVLPRDYEQITLAQFPEVEKVLCLPGIDSKAQNRSPIVTLVVMQKEKDKKILPLCEHRLLMRIEDYIGDKTSPFITVDAITPVYEEVTVCCNLCLAEYISYGISGLYPEVTANGYFLVDRSDSVNGHERTCRVPSIIFDSQE